jgi:hypothetical protein
VRSHLETCDGCRERLAEHDQLTAAILAGPRREPISRSRVDRVMSEILALPPRFSSAFIESSLPASPPARRSRTVFRAALRVSSLAAAFLLGALLVLLVTWRGPREQPGDETGGLARSTPPPSAAHDNVRRHSAGVAQDLRWIATTAPAPRHPGAAPLLVLHGFRRPVEVVEVRGIVPEWIVEANPTSRPPLEDRFFLVPEGAEETLEGAVEIDPVRWSAAPGVEIPASPRGATPPRPCRVFVIHGVSSLGRQALPADAFPARLLGPDLPPGVTNPWKRYSGWRQ